MPTSLALDQHLAALEAAGTRLAETAARAGLDAGVPTCPDWTVRELVAHQAMVHRWAAGQLRGEDEATAPSEGSILSTVPDLLGYYREGHRALLDTLRDAPEDLEAPTFLNDAPRPREFWARRQTHETTIHLADALAAALGRPPTAGEAAIGVELAADGIDELVSGFLTRSRCKLYDGVPYDVLVAPDDVDRRWLLHVGPKLTVEPVTAADAAGDPAVTVTGSAAAIYLGLWNRTDGLDCSDDPDFAARWRASNRVRWS